MERATNERLVGSRVTLAMAKDEGWSTKSGSKWKTMPEQMMMYRAAAFFVRAYAPEISMGLQTADELADGVIDAEPGSVLTLDELQQPAAPATTAPTELPAFDFAAAHRRLAECTDRELLALDADSFRDLPDGPETAALMQAWRERDAALAGEG